MIPNKACSVGDARIAIAETLLESTAPLSPEVTRAIAISMSYASEPGQFWNQRDEAAANILLRLTLMPDQETKEYAFIKLNTMALVATEDIRLSVIQSYRYALAITPGKDKTEIAFLSSQLGSSFHEGKILLNLKQQEALFDLTKDVSCSNELLVRGKGLRRVGFVFQLCPSQTKELLEYFHGLVVGQNVDSFRDSNDHIARGLASDLGRISRCVRDEKDHTSPHAFRGYLRDFEDIFAHLAEHEDIRVRTALAGEVAFITESLPELGTKCDEIFELLSHDVSDKVQNELTKGFTLVTHMNARKVESPDVILGLVEMPSAFGR